MKRSMKNWVVGLELAAGLGVALMAALGMAQARGQAAPAAAVREILDPHTGARWLLERDASHPGGPGRLVLGAAGSASSPRSVAGPKPAGLPPSIHLGDRLIVEEDTPVVSAWLEAVALGPALAGEGFMVRLRIGGKVMRAVALGPGRAVFALESEARP
jgi:hypothetical protein